MSKKFYCEMFKFQVTFDTLNPPFYCFCSNCQNRECKLKNTCVNCKFPCFFSACKEE